MTARDLLLESLRAAVGGDPWHGSSLDALLDGVTAAQAAAHPIPAAHSILEITWHLAAWTQEVAARLRGSEPHLPAIGDWPAAADDHAGTWRDARRALHAAHAEVLRMVSALSDEQFAEPVGTVREATFGTGVSRARMLAGLLEHDAYHGGQIALLKRALGIG
jgi:uncharacterized damage-inducible protein DinB